MEAVGFDKSVGTAEDTSLDALFYASSFLEAFLASLRAEGEARERYLALASVDLELMLDELRYYLKAREAVEAVETVSARRLDDLALSLGGDVLERALTSSVKALVNGWGLDVEAVRMLAEASGWGVDPAGMDEEVAASATVLTFVAAFNKTKAAF